MKVLIIGLLLNDDAKKPEMKNMTDAIETAQRKTNDVHVATYNVAKLPKGPIQGRYDEIIVTGHSKSYDVQRGTYLGLNQRKLGGYDIQAASELIVNTTLSAKATTVSIWCCESALDVETAKLLKKDGNEAIKVLSEQGAATIAENRDQFSTVASIACDLRTRKQRGKDRGEVVVRGLNGVGDVGDDGSVRAFDQKDLEPYNKLNDAKRELTKARGEKVFTFQKNIQNYEAQVERNIKSKKSPDICGYKVCYLPPVAHYAEDEDAIWEEDAVGGSKEEVA